MQAQWRDIWGQIEFVTMGDISFNRQNGTIQCIVVASPSSTINSLSPKSWVKAQSPHHMHKYKMEERSLLSDSILFKCMFYNRAPRNSLWCNACLKRCRFSNSLNFPSPSKSLPLVCEVLDFRSMYAFLCRMKGTVIDPRFQCNNSRMTWTENCLWLTMMSEVTPLPLSFMGCFYPWV